MPGCLVPGCLVPGCLVPGCLVPGCLVPGCLGADGDNTGSEQCDNGVVLERQSCDAVAWVS